MAPIPAPNGTALVISPNYNIKINFKNRFYLLITIS